MSFADEVRKELIESIKKDYKNRLYFVYGMLLFSKNHSKKKLEMILENKTLLKIIKEFFKKEIDIKILIDQNNSDYHLALKNTTDYKKLYDYFISKDMDITTQRINENFIKAQGKCVNFLSAVFIFYGTISDPKKSYQLEFFLSNDKLNNSFHGFLAKLGFDFKIAKRKKASSSVYTRDSTVIEEILTFMGAPVSAMKIMNVKAEKQIRNRVNRQTNFEAANLEKTATAYAEQRQDIEYILNNTDINKLDNELKKIIDIRSIYPDLSLKDLGEKYNPPISRSAVNYRIQKIRKYADKLRNEKKKKEENID